ncbi:MAG: DUF3592 domain-containing protein [Chloroflexota bacterium]
METQDNVELLIWLTLGGLFIVSRGLFKVWKQFETRNWKRTIGEMLETEIVKTKCIVRNREVDDYRPRVLYRYEVNKEIFTGNRLQYGRTGHHTHRQQAEYVLERFHKIDKLTVYFNPDNPEESILIRDAMSSGALGYLLLGGLLIAMGIWLYLNA